MSVGSIDRGVYISLDRHWIPSIGIRLADLSTADSTSPRHSENDFLPSIVPARRIRCSSIRNHSTGCCSGVVLTSIRLIIEPALRRAEDQSDRARAGRVRAKLDSPVHLDWTSGLGYLPRLSTAQRGPRRQPSYPGKKSTPSTRCSLLEASGQHSSRQPVAPDPGDETFVRGPQFALRSHRSTWQWREDRRQVTGRSARSD